MPLQPWKVAAVAGVFAGVGYLVVAEHDLARETLWRLTILGSCAAIVAGLRIHRHANRHPWWLMLAALSLIGVANLLTYPVWAPEWGESAADLLSMVAFPLIGIAAIAIFRLQAPGGDRESAVDGLIVMIAMATVLAGTVFHPDQLDHGGSLSSLLLNSVVAPLMMAAVTAATFRLLFIGSARIPSVWLVVFASSAGLFGNTMRAFSSSHGTYQRGAWSDLFILLSYIAIGLAVLHPSSPQLVERFEEHRTRFTHARLIVLGAALLAAPATLILQGSASSVPVLASVLLSLLVLWRLSQLVVDRERSRRELHQRADRQEALAQLGLRAVDDPDLAALMEEATQTASVLLELRDVRVADVPPTEPTRAVSRPLRDGRVFVAEREREWNPEDLAFLQAIVNVLAGAVERHAAQELLVRQAVYDELTGLPNRTLLLDRLEQELAGCRSGDGVLTVMFVDLDGFKQVNDDHGHHSGDQLLIAVAERLLATVRADDTVGRLAGDEFIVIGRYVGPNEASRLADRIRDELGRPFHLDDATVVLSASIGLVVSDGWRVDPERLLAQADAAMYEAKRRPGGAIETYDERLDDERRERRSLELDLEAAFDRDELHLVYQPLVRTVVDEGHRIVGVEALLRWVRSTGEPIPPSRFIPIAESSDLIVRIGDRVIERAAQQLLAWGPQLDGDVPFTLYVNLASRQLSDPALPDRVAAILARTGLEPDRLGFEVSETAVLDERAIDVATALSRLGVRLALDDFGTGFSSIAHLKRLPLDLIKLDGSLVTGACIDEDDRAIVRAVVAIARQLGIEVLAEQIETPEQLELIGRLGCHSFQGYLFARPTPADQVELPRRPSCGWDDDLTPGVGPRIRLAAAGE